MEGDQQSDSSPSPLCFVGKWAKSLIWVLNHWTRYLAAYQNGVADCCFMNAKSAEPLHFAAHLMATKYLFAVEF